MDIYSAMHVAQQLNHPNVVSDSDLDDAEIVIEDVLQVVREERRLRHTQSTMPGTKCRVGCLVGRGATERR